MTKAEVIKLWIDEKHPGLKVQPSIVGGNRCQGPDYVLIVDKTWDEPIRYPNRPTAMVEIDFSRNGEIDFIYNYNVSHDERATHAQIADPEYFTKLEDILKKASLI